MAQIAGRPTRFHPTRLVIMITVVVVFLFFIVTSVYNIAAFPSPTSHDPETGYTREAAIMHLSEKNTSDAIVARLQMLEKELSSLRIMLAKTSAGQSKTFPDVRFRNEETRKRILVTGGAGFVGSHLVDKLMMDGHEVTTSMENFLFTLFFLTFYVIALDNYFTGRKHNVEQWIGHPNFELVHHDVVNPYFIEVDQIYHLASPASPPHYMYNPVKTIKTNTLGTINMLGLAKLVIFIFLLKFLSAFSIFHLHICFRRVKATVLLASTSEVYGDPEVHPQPETYWGHVNTVGPRSCYDEGKRVAESLMVAYNKQERVSIRIARIFNTFGPRMHMNDGRVVSNFIIQALQGKPITIYGDGSQTRSFQYVDDLVDGLISLMNSNCSSPVNLGNPEEHSISNFARIIRDLVGSSSVIINQPSQEDDPQQRRPDITRAARELNWRPQVSMREGLKKTIEYFRDQINEHQRLSEEP
ncbi:hypothetical protein RB195_000210 [Necator americanus]|uniref:UDP-glucuronate decarboxylase n=1 Tax=Necator americanus TaxID=51031 RepID=A0ABR1D9Y4_NECAM